MQQVLFLPFEMKPYIFLAGDKGLICSHKPLYRYKEELSEYPDGASRMTGFRQRVQSFHDVQACTQGEEIREDFGLNTYLGR